MSISEAASQTFICDLLAPAVATTRSSFVPFCSVPVNLARDRRQQHRPEPAAAARTPAPKSDALTPAYGYKTPGSTRFMPHQRADRSSVAIRPQVSRTAALTCSLSTVVAMSSSFRVMSLPIQTGHRRRGRSGVAEREFCVHRRLLPSSYMSGGHAARFEEKWAWIRATDRRKTRRTHVPARRFCNRLLRRPSTGRHRRLLRAGCGSQVERRKRLWMWISDSTRRADEGGVLHLSAQTANLALNAYKRAASDISGGSPSQEGVMR